MRLSFDPSAVLAATIALAGCDAQMQIGSMQSESDLSDSGMVSTPDAPSGRGDGDVSPGSTADAAGAIDESRDTRVVPDVSVVPDASLGDGAPLGDTVRPPDRPQFLTDGWPPDVAKTDGSAPCPNWSRAPVSCLLPGASPVEAPIDECFREHLTFYDERQLITSLKADPQGVYWRGADLSLRALLTGAVTAQTLAFIAPHDFAIDDEALYFVTEQDAARVDLKKIKRDGTGLTLIAPNADGNTAIAVAPDRVYFNPEFDSLAWAPKAGGGPVSNVVTGRVVHNVVADAANVYWTESLSDASSNGTSTIWRAAHGSTAIEMVAAGLRGVQGMWEQGNGLVLLSEEVGPLGEHVAWHFSEVPKTGGCARILIYLGNARFPYRIKAVTMDDQTIYWTAVLSDRAEYSVWYGERMGGIAVKLKVVLSDENVAMTATQIFWGDVIPALRTFATLIQWTGRPWLPRH